MFKHTLLVLALFLTQGAESVHLAKKDQHIGNNQLLNLAAQSGDFTQDLGMPSLESFDIMEWFDWIKNNFMAVTGMVNEYEEKLKARK